MCTYAGSAGHAGAKLFLEIKEDDAALVHIGKPELSDCSLTTFEVRYVYFSQETTILYTSRRYDAIYLWVYSRLSILCFDCSIEVAALHLLGSVIIAQYGMATSSLNWVVYPPAILHVSSRRPRDGASHLMFWTLRLAALRSIMTH
jgi:hypothetical protein